MKNKKKQSEQKLEKNLGRLPLVSFKIRQEDGTIIEPWKGKYAEILEWMRNISALLGSTREEIATLGRIEKDAPIYLEEAMVSGRNMDLARFYSEADGREYDVAARLVDKSIKVGDRVKLIILGCCSIANVEKEQEEEVKG